MLSQKAFQDEKKVREISFRIFKLCSKIAQPVKIMEVCGTHTYSFFRYGLSSLLPQNLDFISGPGCPVCVTPSSFIDKAVHLANKKNFIITTYGDLLRVPGKESSLDQARSKARDVRIVYSILDSLRIAKENPSKNIVFLAVGFETTAPATALAILQAHKEKLNNFFVLLSHRLIPPALEVLAQDPLLGIRGFVLPGHVSVIIGLKAYQKIVESYNIGAVAAGFEALDIMSAVLMLLMQISGNSFKLENEYTRLVTFDGNTRAQALLSQVFVRDKSFWRGLGDIPLSGLYLKDEFKESSAEKFIDREFPEGQTKDCLCGEVIKGKLKPQKCPQFKKNCSPSQPQGPCMVSFEGTCRIYYEYRA